MTKFFTALGIFVALVIGLAILTVVLNACLYYLGGWFAAAIFAVSLGWLFFLIYASLN